MSGAGGCYFSVWYGSKMAIQVNKREELPDSIRSVMEAVKQDELDVQIEDVAEQSTSELRLKTQLKPVKKVS
jgi:threonine synthase